MSHELGLGGGSLESKQISVATRIGRIAKISGLHESLAEHRSQQVVRLLEPHHRLARRLSLRADWNSCREVEGSLKARKRLRSVAGASGR